MAHEDFFKEVIAFAKSIILSLSMILLMLNFISMVINQLAFSLYGAKEVGVEINSLSKVIV